MKIIYILIFILYTNDLFAEEKDIIILTHEFPNQTVPVNENTIRGLAGEILTQALKKSNITYKIIFLPWKRAQIDAVVNNNKKTFILPLTRNEEREKNYLWVSKLYDLNTLFLSNKNQDPINSINDAKNKKIGVLLGTSFEDTLNDPKYNLNKDDIELSYNHESIIKKLIGGRLDGWYDVKIDIISELKKENLNLSDFHFGKKILIEENYIATSKSISKELYMKVTNAFESFKKTPDYDKILKKYLEDIN